MPELFSNRIASPARTLIVSPYAAVRAGLHAMLEGECGIAVVGEVASAGDVSDASASLSPDVIVIDDADESPIEPVRVQDGLLPIVLLTERCEADLTALGPPAGGLLPRDADAAEIVAAVRGVHAGLTVVHPAFLSSLTSRPAVNRGVMPSISDGDRLTGREREVLQLIAGGLPNKQIAVRLGVSPHTVKFHVASLLAKLNASSRAEAVSTGVRLGYVTL